jgi:pimeloyl-ACP methyl ester carboxylesterase
LIVLLPGIHDRAESFEYHGFVESARNGLEADIAAVDATFGYYLHGNFIERLHTDVIVPARQHGYRDIWLVGVSLGGFGSLLYAKAYPEHIRGVFLIAPFLGNGPDNGVDTAEWLAARNGEDGFWEWLRHHTSEGAQRPEIILVYGADDRFAPVNRQLAELLPSENVDYLPGGHDWETWRVLWERAIENNMLPLPGTSSTDY